MQNRYLLLSISFAPDNPTPPNISEKQLVNLVRTSLLNNFGSAAVGALGGPLNCKQFFPKTNLAILRCQRTGVETIRAACTLIGSTAGREVRVQCIGVSGTIKKCFERVIKVDRRVIQMEKAKMNKKTKEKRKQKAAGVGKKEVNRSTGETDQEAEVVSTLDGSTEVKSLPVNSLMDEEEDLGLAV